MTGQVLHDTATIFVPRSNSRLALCIDPGSGIVGILTGGGLILYFEGIRLGATNLEDPVERVICAFGRAATRYPTIAMMEVHPEDMVDLVRVGEIRWPNRVSWDSDWSERIFRDYAGRSKPLVTGERQAISHSNVLEVFAPALMGDYDVPNERTEWRWIEAHASFENNGNGAIHGVWEFMLRVRAEVDGDDYECQPPERIAEVISWARERGYAYILFHQG